MVVSLKGRSQMAKKGIAAFAFGVPATIWSNRQIADTALSYAEKDGSKIFTQLDVSFGNLDQRDVERLPGEKPNAPPPTLRIARWVVKRAIEEGIGEVIVVAARPHIYRAMRDMEMAAEEAGFLQLLIKPASEIWDWPEAKWYCKDSTQSRAQSKENWRDREAILEMMPFDIYKHIAK